MPWRLPRDSVKDFDMFKVCHLEILHDEIRKTLALSVLRVHSVQRQVRNLIAGSWLRGVGHRALKVSSRVKLKDKISR